MEKLENGIRNVGELTARTSLRAEFGSMVAQLGETLNLKLTGGDSVSVPGLSEYKLPNLETQTKIEAPPLSGKPDAPLVHVATTDAKVKDVASAFKNQTLPLYVVVSKVETAFKSEPDKVAMQVLANRINTQLRGSGVSLDLKMIGSDPTRMFVTIQGIGRPYNVMIGPGTDRMDVGKAGTAHHWPSLCSIEAI